MLKEIITKKTKKKEKEFEPIFLGFDEHSEERYKRNSQSIVDLLNELYSILNQEQFKDAKKEIYQALKDDSIESYIEATLRNSTPAFQSINYPKLLSLFSIDTMHLSVIQKTFNGLIRLADIKFVDGYPTAENKEFPYYTTTKEQNDLCAFLFLKIDTFEHLLDFNPNLNRHTYCQALLNLLRVDNKGQLAVNPQTVLATVKYKP